MRIASGLARDHRVLAVTIFFIVAALLAGATACNGARTYQLTISSASGGSVTSPGEGTFPYRAGTAVPLMATPDNGYEFLSWMGDTAYIANPNAASTTITMNGNYAVLANFLKKAEPAPSE